MADTAGATPARGALDAHLQPRRAGRKSDGPGVTVQELRGLGLALVTARRGQAEALAQAVQTHFGLALPTSPRHVAGGGLQVIWRGPERWLVAGPAPEGQSLEARLAPALAGLASVVEQSHGMVVLRVSGPRVRDALVKGVTIDLHPRAFSPGQTAVTHIAHLGVQISHLDAAPTYELAFARSTAVSFWHWLEASAAKFGLEILAPVTSDGRIQRT